MSVGNAIDLEQKKDVTRIILVAHVAFRGRNLVKECFTFTNY
jgi:hypothetical protein